MSIVTYLTQSGLLPADMDAASCNSLLAAVEKYQTELKAAVKNADLKLEVQWQYQVPELGEGGSCSLFGQLAAEPYDVSAILGGKTPANHALLARLGAISRYYQSHSQSNWFGIYQKRQNSAGETVLVKLSYFGEPSRAEFPLTTEFAAISNNSSVGLSGKARIINDVPAYLQQGGEYYTCDPKVLAEACIPLFADSGELVGIIDSEAFVKDLFHRDELALLIAAAMLVPVVFAAAA
ncbi:GAF domain-containing protein [Rheinheimera sp.]|uniref:GAF domain-containing protein n=1 Tax=Rheinheimera sp. TaxID=1869214 RepID=UPI0025D4AD8A|nr:histidine kinase [Rheinheimera sp.]